MLTALVRVHGILQPQIGAFDFINYGLWENLKELRAVALGVVALGLAVIEEIVGHFGPLPKETVGHVQLRTASFYVRALIIHRH